MKTFKEMSLNELRSYVLKNRSDAEAWEEFASRPRPNAVTIPASLPQEEQDRMLEELIS
ncbi:hypothetical protein Xen7305DRAFT_00008240 [Xenococcus sp. PCC 7305]|uniref:DUF6887 family protein n=1 Tax=Xenococcus sp. PCC 7305 TaxID=102125 RepID=UPI0002AC70BC|nr:hypothetical protein [Xenococcus sp. PCC 7305]ELS01122.1 hypothetical protein Xen7305DRAFT_00008240 [Xenococcus sp. PCC 7305]